MVSNLKAFTLFELIIRDFDFQVIFQTVIDQVHLLHEKEEWHQEITDEYGAITELPDMFGAIVTESVQVIVKPECCEIDQNGPLRFDELFRNEISKHSVFNFVSFHYKKHR